jgi:CDP-diacylglycerol--serine O-phosphatidyltransferase
MIKNIPNALTLLNLFCGALAVVSILNLHIEEALVLHGICLLADFLDGLISKETQRWMVR